MSTPTKHTPEPERYVVVDEFGGMSGAHAPLHGMDEANARKQVARYNEATGGNVNARAIPLLLTYRAPDLLRERDELKASNAKLLAALKGMVAGVYGTNNYDGFMRGDFHPEHNDVPCATCVARAAIQSAEGK